MKKRLSSLLAILLVVAMGLSLVACGDEGGSTAPAGNESETNATLDEYLATVKVGSVDRDDFMVAKGGLYYREDDKYGIMSYVGLHDTGAVYAYMNEKGKYFAVSKKAITDSTPVADLNSLNLVDGNGNVLISGYANYYLLGERYAVAMTVTGRCYNEDDAVVSYKDGAIYNSASTDYNMYAGSWCVYDLNTGKKVPGISGKKHPNLLEYGNLFKCGMEDGSWQTYNCNGEVIEGKIFDDGSYAQEGKIGTVYNPDGSKRFDYDLTGYTPTSLSEDGNYYIAQLYQNDEYTYTVLDKKGKMVSKEFKEHLDVCGELIFIQNKVYNFDGVKVIDGEYDSLDKDAILDGVWMLRQDNTYTMINKDGGVLFSETDDDDHTVFASEFVASEKRDDETYMYSHKDQGYTLKGYSFAPWLVKIPTNNYMNNLVDTISGKTVLEGYDNFSSNSYNDFAYYVYAKYNGGADVYLVVAGSQLAEVEQKKTDLLNDLIAAFESEGIEVNIDKETGAMSLGSDILFQPDKAELSAKGKTELGKFLKAYSKVAFSDKYAGFINKTIIEGHIAPDGDSYASGLALSEERADVVLNYCLSAGKGDVTNSLQAIGYSNSQPVYNEDGSVNMEKSRRVSFRFMMSIEF